MRLLLCATGATHLQLARRAGIATSTLSNTLSDRSYPHPANLSALAGALAVEVLELEDDQAFFVALARKCGVTLPKLHPPSPHGELDVLLDEIGPERAAGALATLRGLIGMVAERPGSGPSKVADSGGHAPRNRLARGR